MPLTKANQTIPGSYRIVQIDGQDVPMHRLADGRWVTTEERLHDEAARDLEFMQRFADTTTVPHDCPNQQPQCPVLERKRSEETDAFVRQAKETRAHLDAYLGEILGPPEPILAGDEAAVSHARRAQAVPGVWKQVLGLVRVYRSERWNRVVQVIAGSNS